MDFSDLWVSAMRIGSWVRHDEQQCNSTINIGSTLNSSWVYFLLTLTYLSPSWAIGVAILPWCGPTSTQPDSSDDSLCAPELLPCKMPVPGWCVHVDFCFSCSWLSLCLTVELYLKQNIILIMMLGQVLPHTLLGNLFPCNLPSWQIKRTHPHLSVVRIIFLTKIWSLWGNNLWEGLDNFLLASIWPMTCRWCGIVSVPELSGL